jgi:hypothetical protein
MMKTMCVIFPRALAVRRLNGTPRALCGIVPGVPIGEAGAPHPASIAVAAQLLNAYRLTSESFIYLAS